MPRMPRRCVPPASRSARSAPLGRRPRDRALRAPDQSRRFLPRGSFQVAEYNRHAVPLGKLAQLLVEDREQLFAEVDPIARDRFRYLRERPLARDSPGVRSPEPAGRVVCDRVEPFREQPARPWRAGLASQHEERGLERVVRVGVVAKHAPAHAEDQTAVPPHERREGLLIALLHEEVKELTVGAVSPHESGNVADIQNLDNWVGHSRLGTVRLSTDYSPPTASLIHATIRLQAQQHR